EAVAVNAGAVAYHEIVGQRYPPVLVDGDARAKPAAGRLHCRRACRGRGSWLAARRATPRGFALRAGQQGRFVRFLTVHGVLLRFLMKSSRAATPDSRIGVRF